MTDQLIGDRLAVVVLPVVLLAGVALPLFFRLGRGLVIGGRFRRGGFIALDGGAGGLRLLRGGGGHFRLVRVGVQTDDDRKDRYDGNHREYDFPVGFFKRRTTALVLFEDHREQRGKHAEKEADKRCDHVGRKAGVHDVSREIEGKVARSALEQREERDGRRSVSEDRRHLAEVLVGRDQREQDRGKRGKDHDDRTLGGFKRHRGQHPVEHETDRKQHDGCCGAEKAFFFLC